MRLELRQEEEALASRETPPESNLLRLVEELVFEVDNGGPIMTCLYEDVESGIVELWPLVPISLCFVVLLWCMSV